MIPEVVLLALLINQVEALFMIASLDMEGTDQIEVSLDDVSLMEVPLVMIHLVKIKMVAHLVMVVILQMLMTPLIMRNTQTLKIVKVLLNEIYRDHMNYEGLQNPLDLKGPKDYKAPRITRVKRNRQTSRIIV